MISFVLYFVPPSLLFLLFVKLNQRYCLVRKIKHYIYDDYVIFNKQRIDSALFFGYWMLMFFIWPFLIPISVILAILYLSCKWIAGGNSIIPDQKKSENYESY